MISIHLPVEENDYELTTRNIYKSNAQPREKSKKSRELVARESIDPATMMNHAVLGQQAPSPALSVLINQSQVQTNDPHNNIRQSQYNFFYDHPYSNGMNSAPGSKPQRSMPRNDDRRITINHRIILIGGDESKLRGDQKFDSRRNKGKREPRKAEIRCFNCKEQGHLLKDCPEKITRIFCFRCGKDDNIAPNCTNCLRIKNGAAASRKIEKLGVDKN